MVIGVYGLGRFGRFWSEKLMTWGIPRGHQFLGYSRSRERKTPRGMERIAEEEFSRCDTVILCTAISSLEEVLPRLAPLLSPEAAVMDTCSVKVQPAQSMEIHLPESHPLLGTHPMFGPDSGKMGIANLPMVLTPVRCSPEMTALWEANFREMGLKVLVMTPDEHDREAAYTQGVTHFIGRVLKELNLRDSPMATTGYQELLKIVEQTCNDPIQLFLDLQKYNPHTRQMRLELQKALDANLKLMDRR